MTDDQRTPDLDAAPDLDDTIDATVRALTTVRDEAAADSLRRTRTALAEAAPRRAGLGAWRWALPAVAMTTVLVAVMLWRPWTPVDAPRVLAETRPPVASAPAPFAPAPAPLPSAKPAPVAPIAIPQRRTLSESRGVRATSFPAPPAAHAPARSPLPDPLAALIAAVQEIPEDVWAESRARADAPIAVADVPLAPITVTALDMPSISTLPADPIAPGEP
jgi:hypothetical protein